MHELSIAMGIVEMAEEEMANRNNAHVYAVHLRLGCFSGVVKEALLSSYEIACTSGPLEGSQLLIEDVPVEIYCTHCQAPRAVVSIQQLHCAECGTPSADVVHGKEIEVTFLEITE
jgi:hydrogenase nickel incorporation protein HypA/HybF